MTIFPRSETTGQRCGCGEAAVAFGATAGACGVLEAVATGVGAAPDRTPARAPGRSAAARVGALCAMVVAGARRTGWPTGARIGGGGSVTFNDHESAAV